MNFVLDLFRIQQAFNTTYIAIHIHLSSKVPSCSLPFVPTVYALQRLEGRTLPSLLYRLAPHTPKIATMTPTPGRTTPMAMVEGPLKPPSLPLPSRPCEDVVEVEGGGDDDG